MSSEPPKSKRRSVIGEDPFDALIPSRPMSPPAPVTAPAPAPISAPRTTAAPQRPPERIARPVETITAPPIGEEIEEEPGSRKVRATFHLPQDLFDHARDAVYWTPGLTLAGLCEQALRKALDELEAERGGPFPRRGAELKGGRPVKMG